MDELQPGSCLCGAVRFEVSGAFDRFYLCHCSYCRKDSGSAHTANLFSSTATLKWNAGEEQTTSFKLPGTRHRRCFCSICGSALPYVAGSMLVVPAGSLGGDFARKPDAHLFVASKARWDEDLNALPRLDGLPT